MTVIEGRLVHKKSSNALQQDFRSGPGDPIAVALQSAGDGRGRKVGILFGFINGGTGTHVLTYGDGQTLRVESRSGAPTRMVRGDGVEIATVEREDDGSVARAAGGTEVVRFAGDSAGAKTVEAYRLTLSAADGSNLGRLDVIRTLAGWTITQSVMDTAIWWDRAGAPLKVPFLGTRLELEREPSDLERDVLLGACVDMAIGLRPYVKDMK